MKRHVPKRQKGEQNNQCNECITATIFSFQEAHVQRRRDKGRDYSCLAAKQRKMRQAPPDKNPSETNAKRTDTPFVTTRFIKAQLDATSSRHAVLTFTKLHDRWRRFEDGRRMRDRRLRFTQARCLPLPNARPFVPAGLRRICARQPLIARRFPRCRMTMTQTTCCCRRRRRTRSVGSGARLRSPPPRRRRLALCPGGTRSPRPR
jgi:hypothetical protein